MSAIIGVSIDTLKNRFSAIIQQGKEEGRRSLRRLQWAQAERGNTTMLLWLGKQMLGQRDRQPDEAAQVHYNVFCNEVPKSSLIMPATNGSLITEDICLQVEEQKK